MKNIHLLYTDKPSRLFYLASNLHLEEGQLISPKNYQNIYITSDEEIISNCWIINIVNGLIYKIYHGSHFKDDEHQQWRKIILTTDQDLIKDGVQAIDDEFLEWFVQNPSCEWVEVVKTAPIRPFGSLYKIIIPKEEDKKKHIVMLVGDKVNDEQTKCYCGHTTYCDCGPEESKQETLEEVAEKRYQDNIVMDVDIDKDLQRAFINGAKWMQERMYSEEEVYQLLYDLSGQVLNNKVSNPKLLEQWFNKFKKK